MKRDNWDIAGLTDLNGSLIHRLGLRVGEWFAPEDVEVVEDGVVWLPGDLARVEVVKPQRGMLDRFVSLADTSPNRVSAFAKQWGVLEICKHGLIATHGNALDWCPSQGFEGRPGWFWAPLEVWRSTARQMRAMLSITAALHRGHSTESGDWVSIQEEFGDKLAGERPGIQMEALSSVANDWIQLGGVLPTVRMRPDRSEVMLASTSGLFGALVTQLAAALTRSEGLGVCVSCNRVYSPSRKPQAGRRSFCPECRDAGAPARFAMRDYNAKLRTGKLSSNQEGGK